MTDRREALNTGDVLHMLQIAALLIAAGVAYGKFNVIAEQSQENHVQLNRIEHYLSSRDPRYWELTKEQ